MQFIGDISRLNAKRWPDKRALIMEAEFLTFGELNKRANQLAHGLMSIGVKPGEKVALLAYNCLECVIVNYGVAKCGGIVVPVNFRYKKDELVYLINDCEPGVLLFGPEFSSLVEEAIPEFVKALLPVAISGEPLGSGITMKELMDGKPGSEPNVHIDPGSAFIITYTSGTTGAPKGVLASHSSFLNIYQGMVVEGDLQPDEVTLVNLPLFHTGGMHALVQPTLIRGGTAVIMGKGFDPDKVLDSIARYKVTMTMWVPTMLAMLVTHPNVGRYNLSSLKKIWYGSSAISPTVLEAAQDLFKTNFYQWYGQTETGMISVLRPEDHIERSQATGREMFNADLRVVDEEGEMAPMGEVGEIISAQKYHGMIGYHNMEEATKKTIRDGWIHTGDLAKVDGNGYFTIVDRISDLIISGAENIYPKEIEDIISCHPGVQEVAVFGIPDDVWGESVCAVVSTREGFDLDEREIVDFCASRLSGYKKPKRVEFMSELPKNPSGKIMKKAIREPYWVGRGKRV